MKIIIFILLFIILCFEIYKYTKTNKEHFTITKCPDKQDCPDCKQKIDCEGSFTPERCQLDCVIKFLKLQDMQKTVENNVYIKMVK